MFTAEELQNKIEKFRKMPSETEWLEFKEARNSYSFDELGKYFSALSNEANLKQKQSGWLIFGIKDKLPRDIAWTRYRPDRKSLESLKHEVAQQTNGITFQEIYELSLLKGRILMFQITWKLDAEEQAYEHFGPPFLLTVEEVFRRIRNVKFRIQPFNRLIPIELTKYDSKIVLEALNNCIAHQDYIQNARIVVTEKVDRLILQNIGGFYDGTVEDYVLRERTPERYRNPFLAQAMVNLDMIDTMGMGIRRMFLEQRRRFFPLPEYDLQEPNHVRMTIYGKLIDENYSRILIEKEDLALTYVIALDKIQKKERISQEVAKKLRQKKLIEGRYPHLFVAAKIAQATESKVDYTKHKAFDKQYYKDLILRFLEQHGEAKPEDFQRLLADKLSDLLTEKQKKAKVRNLIQEMAREGILRNLGGRGLLARWHFLD